MFKMFQGADKDGANILDPQENPKLFQGKLMIVVKDVARKDQYDVEKEFESKLGEMVHKEAEHNFVSRLHSGAMMIVAWPIFTDPDFYTQMLTVCAKLRQARVRDVTARIWKEEIKTLMGKLMISDWGSVDKSMVAMRCSQLLNTLPIAIQHGMEDLDPPEPLRYYDDDTIVVDEFAPLDLTTVQVDGLPTLVDLPIAEDAGLKLLVDVESFHVCAHDLFEFFEKHTGPRSDAASDKAWFDACQTFISFLVDRRAHRITQWISNNVARFIKMESELKNLSLVADTALAHKDMMALTTAPRITNVLLSVTSQIRTTMTFGTFVSTELAMLAAPKVTRMLVMIPPILVANPARLDMMETTTSVKAGYTIVARLALYKMLLPTTSLTTAPTNASCHVKEVTIKTTYAKASVAVPSHAL
ncbi:hypothetical protein HDV00_012367 [Rhizophlyctis rosea]|nr:hypothetical protein HDV00_012367 [Rhizophlyctis rosea]